MTKAVGNNEVFGTLLTEGTWCACHDLLFAKRNAWSLLLSTLKMIQDYLQNRKQRIKIGSSSSIWEDTTSGVSQGSILGPLLFNVFLCDFSLEYGNNYFTNYADNTKIYIVDKHTNEVLTKLSTLAQKIHIWFANNQTKADHDKYHLLLSTQESTCVKIEYFTVKCCEAKTMLGININNKLKFHVYVGIIGQKANRKLNALTKITNYMELPKNLILMNAFFTIQFNYCPAIWMFQT